MKTYVSSVAAVAVAAVPCLLMLSPSASAFVVSNGVNNVNINAASFVQKHSALASAAQDEDTETATVATTAVATVTTAPEEDINPRKQGLALQLDDGTRKSHSMAENSAFVTGFFKGLSTKESYRNLITSLYFVYEAMEHVFDTTTNTDVQQLDDVPLRRLDALRRDMDYFYGQEWKSVIEPTAGTQAYVNRIREIAETKPYLLIAHQYTRYLGDLFGGQMMGGMATRSLNLEAGKGVAFYTFDDIPSTKNFITDWYARLNALDLTEAQKEEIVDEANLVFALNIVILQEVEGSPLKAMWTLAINTLKEKLGVVRK